MEGRWIVNTGANIRFGQVFLQAFAVSNANSVEVENSAYPIRTIGADHLLHRRQQIVISLGGSLPAGVPLGKVSQFGCQNSRLDRIQAAVIAFDIVIILASLAVVAQHAHLAREYFVIGRDRTCLAARSQILSRVEAKSSGSAH